MSDKVEINCDELAKKMNECLENHYKRGKNWKYKYCINLLKLL